MVKKERFKYIFAMILSGAFVTMINIFTEIPKPIWNNISWVVNDIKFTGALLLAFYVCPYKLIQVKAASFFLAMWSALTAVFNMLSFQGYWSTAFIAFFGFIWLIWLYRLSNMKTIETRELRDNEAYYIFIPIKSIWGLFQAVFLPWHPARYESRLIIDGVTVYSIHHGKFSKKLINQTNINRLEGVRIPLVRRLTQTELKYLNSLTGKRFIPGFRDCRKFLVEDI